LRILFCKDSNFLSSIDYNVACSYDIESAFPHVEPPQTQHSVEMSIPVVAVKQDFCSITEEPSNRQGDSDNLDDMRFLFLALIKHAETRLFGVRADESNYYYDHGSESGSPHCQTAHHLLHLPLTSDFIYKSCRIAALIYCQTTVERVLPTKVFTLKELNHLWANMWRVKLPCRNRFTGFSSSSSHLHFGDRTYSTWKIYESNVQDGYLVHLFGLF